MKKWSSNSKIVFLLTRSKKQICPFWGPKKLSELLKKLKLKFKLELWRLFFEVKGRNLQIFLNKIFIFRSLWYIHTYKFCCIRSSGFYVDSDYFWDNNNSTNEIFTSKKCELRIFCKQLAFLLLSLLTVFVLCLLCCLTFHKMCESFNFLATWGETRKCRKRQRKLRIFPPSTCSAIQAAWPTERRETQ